MLVPSPCVLRTNTGVSCCRRHAAPADSVRACLVIQPSRVFYPPRLLWCARYHTTVLSNATGYAFERTIFWCSSSCSKYTESPRATLFTFSVTPPTPLPHTLRFEQLHEKTSRAEHIYIFMAACPLLSKYCELPDVRTAARHCSWVCTTYLHRSQ